MHQRIDRIGSIAGSVFKEDTFANDQEWKHAAEINSMLFEKKKTWEKNKWNTGKLGIFDD